MDKNVMAKLVVYGQPKMTKAERRELREWLIEKGRDIVREEDFANRVVFTYENPFRTVPGSGHF